MTVSRVLVAPLNYSHRQKGQVDAFAEVFGHLNIREFDFMEIHRQGMAPNEMLINSVINFQPDWIWLQVQGSAIIAGTTIERIRAALPKCIITHWMGDARLTVPDDLADICRTTHGTLVSSVGQLPMYQAAGAKRTLYCQIGLDWDQDVLGLPAWEPPFRVPDVVFCGGHYENADFRPGTTERLSAIRRLMREEGIDVGVVGTGWPSDIPVAGQCHVKQQIHVYKRAKVVLSINHFNHIERYYSDRQLIAMASGTPVVCRYVPGLETEFLEGIECEMWRTEDELVQYVRDILSDQTDRLLVGTNGRTKVICDHTWSARIRQILPTINTWRDEDCR